MDSESWNHLMAFQFLKGHLYIHLRLFWFPWSIKHLFAFLVKECGYRAVWEVHHGRHGRSGIFLHLLTFKTAHSLDLLVDLE
uniref:Uncharacterized protein n=1 Tax=Arundo donax TaxID=35708 RepID=A0A0A9DWF7_ARUDO